MGLLVRVIHWGPALAGLGVTVALIPLSTVVGKQLAAVRRELVGYTDARVKLCTEATTEDRVRKVPRIVRAKVVSTRTKFQDWRIPRRTCTTAEWMNAVAVSHGISAAFSTGSHAQKPPHPSTS